MNKQTLLRAGVLALMFCAGIAAVRIWDAWRTPTPAEPVRMPGSESLLIVDMKGAAEPEGVVDVSEPEYVDDSQVPSQLTKIKVQGLARVVSRSGDEIDAPSEEEPRQPVVLGDVDHTAVPSATAPVKMDPSAEKSNMSMIDAPVQVRVIKSLDDYKKFKQKPAANILRRIFPKTILWCWSPPAICPIKCLKSRTYRKKTEKCWLFTV